MSNNMDVDANEDYLCSESSTGSLDSQSSESASGVQTSYSIRVIECFQLDLLNYQSFNPPNVFRRLGVKKINSAFVERCFNGLQSDPVFQKNKSTLQDIVERSEAKSAKLAAVNMARNMPIIAENTRTVSGKTEKAMRESLYNIFEQIRKFDQATYEREFLSFKSSVRLQGEGDTFSLPHAAPDFTICDVSGERNADYKVKGGGKNIWRLQSACIALRALSKAGPVETTTTVVTEIVAQAAEYAKLHISSRPFQLFSVGLLIFGRKFCVAIFDNSGVELSSVEDMWDNFRLFICVMRRLCCEMSPYELGMDPNVELLELDHPMSRACREFSLQNIHVSTSHPSYKKERRILSAYPTYAIRTETATYFSLGPPIWTSLSFMGRGTTVWKVTKPVNGLVESLFIMKSAWRRSNRTGESAIHERVEAIKKHYRDVIQMQNMTVQELQVRYKGNPEGLVEYFGGADALMGNNRRLTTANLRVDSGNSEENTTILHRTFFTTIGRPIWEFENFLEFFLGIRAALAGHEFLVNEGILHRDINAGNIMLSLNSNVPDERRGFLTDFEFAKVEGKLGVQESIDFPPTWNPSRSTIAASETKTLPVQRGATMTGTIQFMAYELIVAMINKKGVKHESHHDVESFIWVIYYATLRRLGYVNRPLPDVVDPDDEITIDELRPEFQYSFDCLFAFNEQAQIRDLRRLVKPSAYLFGQLLELLPPLLNFFDDLEIYMNVKVRRSTSSSEHPYGTADHESLFTLVDKVIQELRHLPIYQQIPN